MHPACSVQAVGNLEIIMRLRMGIKNHRDALRHNKDAWKYFLPGLHLPRKDGVPIYRAVRDRAVEVKKEGRIC